MYTWTAVIAGMTLAWTFAPVYMVPFSAAGVGILLYTALPRFARRLP
jgi:hypothetical protein